MKTYIYFIRHAISPFTLDNEQYRGLSEQGKLDSRQVADLLKNEGIDVIVSSTFARAIDTVRPLADILGKEIVQYEELAERAIASIKNEIAEVDLLRGIERSFVDIDYCMLEGETTRQAQQRSIPIINKLIIENKGKKIAIGTHGNIMTIILNYFEKNYGYEFWAQTSKPDIYKLEFEEMDLKHVERLWKS
ncbi:histidine phosphatase family protein [Paenibacillus wynnii]|uniref:histidine phosphatase family protein n=1 Tax=Paenibacillus wynnii TaxID=268407 RepID=UPI002793039D|nr:histidine phosphatase family protein [Paenibacillus wynnii]MDQ0195577.1 2,3-bisphosphoglycerate-dependent phosphoglycerate mutase [Paenibacillus wynnii]